MWPSLKQDAEIRRTVLMLSNKYYQLFQDWIKNPEIRRKEDVKKTGKRLDSNDQEKARNWTTDEKYEKY